MRNCEYRFHPPWLDIAAQFLYSEKTSARALDFIANHMGVVSKSERRRTDEHHGILDYLHWLSRLSLIVDQIGQVSSDNVGTEHFGSFTDRGLNICTILTNAAQRARLPPRPKRENVACCNEMNPQDFITVSHCQPILLKHVPLRSAGPRRASNATKLS